MGIAINMDNVPISFALSYMNEMPYALYITLILLYYCQEGYFTPFKYVFILLFLMIFNDFP